MVQLMVDEPSPQQSESQLLITNFSNLNAMCCSAFEWESKSDVNVMVKNPGFEDSLGTQFELLRPVIFPGLSP